ncbi:MAG: hypothetical protein IPJ95_00820 [Gemmatimonadetes bacterium]|nr:hypothetical protein [Gemmatimonadota bacterium]MBK7922171.1 hypothetical protein [Gemmatimonadota bacterium]
MSLFDLLFLVLFLVVLWTIGRLGILLARGRRTDAKGLAKRLGWGLGVYFAAIALVSLLSPRRYLGIGDQQCADDWCIAVTDGHPDSLDRGHYVVDFILSSRARGITQRERFVVAYLRDSTGRRYDAEPATGEVPFDTALGPLASVTTWRRYRVSEALGGLGVVISREGGFDFPGCCIIGDEGSLFHKRTIVWLPRRTAPG